MPHQVTVTAKTGPDRTVTGLVLAQIDKIEFELDDKIVRMFQQGGASSVKEFDLASVTTITFSIVGGNYTMVIS
jgi:hypothetical protein